MKRALSRRRLRSEVFPILVALGSMMLAFALIPLDAVFFKPATWRPADPVCAFVRLTPVEETKALAAARAAWQVDRSERGRVRAELVALDSTDELRSPIVAFDDNALKRPFVATEYHPENLPATEAAAAPMAIPAVREEPVLAFPRSDLLKL